MVVMCETSGRLDVVVMCKTSGRLGVVVMCVRPVVGWMWSLCV